MRQLLFVDDEPKILDALRRTLRSMREEWDTHFVGSGAEALEWLMQHPCDIVVSDMRMPGMDGAELLAHIRQRFPHVMRIVLSGQSDQESVLRTVGHAHQYLTKPCDPDELKHVIARAFLVRELVTTETFKRLVTGIDGLPSLPALYQELQGAIQANRSLAELGNIIAQDLGMTSRILQLVNSAFFSLRRTINDAGQAVTFLGLDTIQTLVLGLHAFSAVPRPSTSSLSLEELWAHSLEVAQVAKAIARDYGLPSFQVEAAFTAGLLHDVGHLILETHFPDDYARITYRAAANAPLHVLEREAFHTTHAAVGGYLLGVWGLSDAIIEAVAFHHEPSRCPGQIVTPLTAVHLATVITNSGTGVLHDRHGAGIDTAYVHLIGVAHHGERWEQLLKSHARGAI